MSVLRLLIIALLFYLIYQLLRSLVSSEKPDWRGKDGYPPGTLETEDLVQDPECGVYFPRSEGVATEIDGRVIYFLNRECRDRYLQGRKASHKGGDR